MINLGLLLTTEERKRVDIILDEFKRFHLFFLPELGDIRTLMAATARAEGEDQLGAGEDSHDHSHDDLNYQEEHLYLHKYTLPLLNYLHKL